MLVQLRSRAPDVSHLLGERASPQHLRMLVRDDATLFKPDGSRLMTLRRAAISQEAADAAYPFLHWLRHYQTRNRGNYAGIDWTGDVPGDLRKKHGSVGSSRYHPEKKDGTLSKTTYAAPVRSSVVGFMDRYPRIPFCRSCALSTQKPEEWAACLPLIQEVARIFEKEVPDRYNAQLKMAEMTHPAYVIPRTPFTTLTVNNTVAGGYHTDAGDYKPGFGVMCVLRRGNYRGGEIVIPAYGVGADLGDRDVILFDVHEIHGNTPLVGEGPEGLPDAEGHERISVVFYFRQNMTECLSPAEELERAKARGAIAFEEEGA